MPANIRRGKARPGRQLGLIAFYRRLHLESAAKRIGNVLFHLHENIVYCFIAEVNGIGETSAEPCQRLLFSGILTTHRRVG